MARTGSTSTRSTRKSPSKPATEAVTPEATEEAPEMSTDTVEATDTTTEPAVAEATAEATEAKPAEIDLTDFHAAVETALGNVDTATGTVPGESTEAVKKAYRDLDGAKAKNAAKRSLNDKLRDVVSSGDIVKAQGVMDLVDAVANAGSAPKAAVEKAPADPKEAFVQRLALHNLAYNLVVADAPDGVEYEEASAEAQAKVGELTEQAEGYMAWTKADEESRGDEPEVNPLVKKAVRLALGKVSGTRVGGGTSTPHEGPRGNVARHIQLAFKGQPVGTEMKVAEIVKVKTSEYPDRAPSAGAVNARLKSNNPIEGVEAVQVDGKAGARKTADVEDVENAA